MSQESIAINSADSISSLAFREKCFSNGSQLNAVKTTDYFALNRVPEMHNIVFEKWCSLRDPIHKHVFYYSFPGKKWMENARHGNLTEF